MKHRLIDLLACPCDGLPLRVAAFEMSSGPGTPISLLQSTTRGDLEAPLRYDL